LFFNWVKAHVGIQGNEMADRLAKKAATENIGETVYDKIPDRL
jgi:ribonuclease HI